MFFHFLCHSVDWSCKFVYSALYPLYNSCMFSWNHFPVKESFHFSINLELLMILSPALYKMNMVEFFFLKYIFIKDYVSRSIQWYMYNFILTQSHVVCFLCVYIMRNPADQERAFHFLFFFPLCIGLIMCNIKQSLNRNNCLLSLSQDRNAKTLFPIGL